VAVKEVKFEGDSLETLRAFPEGIRRDIGRQLHALQRGELPHSAKPLNTGMPGVWELRTKDESGQYRAAYVQIVKDQIHVLHCFKKKTAKTGRADLEKTQRRYRDLKARLR
jgi:phage-related protein